MEPLSEEREKEIRYWNKYQQSFAVVDLLKEVERLRDSSAAFTKKHTYRKRAFGACPCCASDPWWWSFDDFKVGDEVWRMHDRTRAFVVCIAPVPDKSGIWIVMMPDGSYVTEHMFMLRHLYHPTMNPYVWHRGSVLKHIKRYWETYCKNCELPFNRHNAKDGRCMFSFHLDEQDDGSWFEGNYQWRSTWFEPDQKLNT